MSPVELPRSRATAEAIDPRGLLAFLDAVDAAAQLELHSLMLLRHGRLVAAGWWAPYRADGPHLLYSLSKSFTSAALGLAVGEGLVDPDATVLSYFGELDDRVSDPRSRAIRVRHLAAMASGHLTDTVEEVSRLDPADPVRGFLSIPPDREPGSVFAYNQPCTYTLAAIVQRQAGCGLVEYLRPRLLDPLGIGEVGWLEHPPGQALGFSGLFATTDAIARLGQLHLQGGVWQGRRLLPAGWVQQATRRQVPTPDEPQPDWRRGYGYQFWLSSHGYRGDGAYGQFCLVLPAQDAVIAITAQTEDMQGILDAVWDHLLPAFDRAGDPADEAALAARLESLELPTPAAAAEPDRPGDWAGARFIPVRPGATSPDLTGVELLRSGDGLRLVLAERAGRLEVPVAAGRWVPAGGPVVASGGWTGPETFTADLVFVETPHRLRVRCALPGRTATAVWRTVPLHAGPLAGLRSP